MKAARKHYEEFETLSVGERLARLEAMKGIELVELLHYAKGREDGPTRDDVIGLVLVVAGDRYLAKQSAKAAKKAKRIL